MIPLISHLSVGVELQVLLPQTFFSSRRLVGATFPNFLLASRQPVAASAALLREFLPFRRGADGTRAGAGRGRGTHGWKQWILGTGDGTFFLVSTGGKKFPFRGPSAAPAVGWEIKEVEQRRLPLSRPRRGYVSDSSYRQRLSVLSNCSALSRKNRASNTSTMHSTGVLLQNNDAESTAPNRTVRRNAILKLSQS